MLKNLNQNKLAVLAVLQDISGTTISSPHKTQPKSDMAMTQITWDLHNNH